MMNKEICEKILTIGCDYKPPRGGIAQVLSSYDSLLFEPFKFVRNSADGNKPKKLWIMLWALVETFCRLLFDRKIKVVHIHTASRNSFRRSVYFARLARFMRHKVIMHIHGGGFKDYYERNRPFVEKALAQCDAIIALSDEWKRFYAHDLGHDNVWVVNNLIPAPHPVEMADDGKLHLLFLGLINEAKGVFDLIGLLAENKEKYAGRLVFHVAGNGDVERLRQVIAEAQLDAIVRYEGWVAGEEKQRLLNQCDVFVLPSYAEGLPISILEAMTYSKAVIASRVGGIPSIVHDGENGRLISPGNSQELVQAIDSFLDDPSLLKRYGECSQRLSQPFLKDSVEQQLKACYNSVLK